MEVLSRHARLDPMEQPPGSQRWREVLDDDVHGASVLSAKLLRIAAEVADAEDASMILARLAEQVKMAHPAIPALLNTVQLLREKLPRCRSLAAAARELAKQIEDDKTTVIAHAVQLISGRPHVMSISYSGLVRDALLAAHQDGVEVHLLIGEGRPKSEGLLLARELASEGVACTVFADMAFTGFFPQTELVIVGADAVFTDTFINKTGTALLLREARSADIPTALIYDFTKCVGEELRPKELPAHPAREIAGKHASLLPENLAVVNRYFEEVPRHLIDVDLHEHTQ